MPYTDFHYVPTGTGVISGKEVLEQTEDAINDLGQQTAAGVDQAIDTANNALNTANTANTNAQNAVNTANTAYTTATNAQNTANTAQNTASNALTAAQNAQNDVDALETVVTGIDGRLTTTEGNVTNLTTRMGTAEGNITTLQNDVVTAQGTATSAQNTATLTRGQAYVVRYANVAVSDNSTVPYTDLNNTDNIKANDLLLDTNGKFYQITSVDSANETVSVTTPLTQLAVDSGVLHNSGNETKSGELTLSDTLNSSDIVPNTNNTYDFGSVLKLLKNLYAYHALFRGQQQGDEYSGNARTNLTLLANRDTIGSSGILFDTFRENTSQGTGMHILGFSMKEDSTRYSGVRLQWIYNTNSLGYDFNLKPTTQGSNLPLTYNLGTSGDKWDTINGLNPGCLSLPDLSSGLDISGSFILDTSSNTYTAPADGWICIKGVSSGTSAIYVESTNGLYASANAIVDVNSTSRFVNLNFPVNKNETYTIVLKSVNSSITAKFFPCLGNV